MDKYIHSIPSLLKTSIPIVVILGNEACDLDSMISSLTYSYLLYNINKNILYIPFWNVYKKDISLRPEMVWLFDILKLENILDNIYCLDNIDIFNNNNFKGIILCDHNKNTLNISNIDLSTKVISIIDHHFDTKTHLSANPCIIREVGSCCSLIADIYLQSDIGKELLFNKADNKDYFNSSSDVLSCLLSCVLIDTSNLTMKTTKLDSDIVKVFVENTNVNCDNIFKILFERRTDVKCLTVDQLFRKDIKFCDLSLKFAISSIPLQFAQFSPPVNTTEFDDAVKNFCIENSLDFYSIMTGYNDSNGYHRGLALFRVSCDNIHFSLDYDIYEKLILYLESSDLQLESISKNNHSYYWNQLNLKASRKQVMPLMESFVNQFNKPKL